MPLQWTRNGYGWSTTSWWMGGDRERESPDVHRTRLIIQLFGRVCKFSHLITWSFRSALRLNRSNRSLSPSLSLSRSLLITLNLFHGCYYQQSPKVHRWHGPSQGWSCGTATSGAQQSIGSLRPMSPSKSDNLVYANCSLYHSFI